MGYVVLFGLSCLTFLAISIYNSRGLPKLAEVPELGLGIVIGATFSTIFLAGIGAILSAILGV